MHVPFCFLGCVHTVRIVLELRSLVCGVIDVTSYTAGLLYIASQHAGQHACLHQGCTLLAIVYCSGSLLVEPREPLSYILAADRKFL